MSKSEAGVTAPPGQRRSSRSVAIALREEFGWRCERRGDATLWTKGYGHNAADCAERVHAMAARPDISALAAWLAQRDGHFAMVIQSAGWTFAATDRVASHPIVWAQADGDWMLDDQAERLRRACGFDVSDVDPDAALSLAMAGYVTGEGTLYRKLSRLGPGEFVLFGDGEGPMRRRYWSYRPWLGLETQSTTDDLKRRLADVTLGVLEKLIVRADGRQILVPLSAGFDSRLILSGLSHLGYRNLAAYTYGLAGNKEIEVARSTAEALDVPWHFIPFTPRSRARRYAEAEHAAYLAYADNCAATPVEHDYASLREMETADWADRDAIVVNGQTGDYISGNHIPQALARVSGVGAQAHWNALRDLMISKHYALWPGILNDGSIQRIDAQLRSNLKEVEAPPADDRTACSLYEFLEFENRQSTYLINGQRAYEFFGYDWALPLWDNNYLDFWERAPLSAKLGQSLYRQTLLEQNWGGVWTQAQVSAAIAPGWMVPIRFAAKAMCAPFGRANWYRFERRFLQYWTDLHCKYAVVPYRRVAFGRAHRSAISWLTEAYLAKKGLDFDGSPMEPRLT